MTAERRDGPGNEPGDGTSQSPASSPSAARGVAPHLRVPVHGDPRSGPLVRGSGAAWARADWILAGAVASLALVPATRWCSIVLAPVVWFLASRERDRAEAAGVRPPDRIVWAAALARVVTCVAVVLVLLASFFISKYGGKAFPLLAVLATVTGIAVSEYGERRRLRRLERRRAAATRAARPRDDAAGQDPSA